MICFVVLVGVTWAAKFEDKWNKFCGEPDCYKTLGLHPNATKARIRRAYRNLSLEYHPDKNPGDRVAAEKFRRVARANEVLTNDDERKKLDYYMENPAEYWQAYGSYVSYAYAPKSSVFTVLFLLLMFASALQPAIQMSKHTQYISKLRRAALNKFPVGGGGTVESLEVRRAAEERMAAEKPNKKLDKKKRLEDAVDAVISEVHIDGPFCKPTWRQVPIVRVCLVPINYGYAAYRSASIAYKRFKDVPLDDTEKQELIERYLGGPDKWDALTDEEQDTLINDDCWERAKFDEWQAKRAQVQAKAARDLASGAPAGPIDAKAKQQVRQRRKGNSKFIMED